MKRIPLTQGKYALVDDEDYPELSAHKWFYGDGYARRMSKHKGKRVVVSMHHFVLPRIPGLEVDHINGNRADNRRCNLRHVTRSQNNANRHALVEDASSRFKGVCWREHAHKWKAYIKVDGRQVHIGYFETEEEAARAYNETARTIYGQYAHLNEVQL